jgi:hypothetical protein
MKRIVFAVLLVLFLWPAGASAHHGGVSLAFGPGTPIETNSPLTLPQGGFVVSTRFEHVDWREFDYAEPNKDVFNFYKLGLSYGITPFLSGTIWFPYNYKHQDSLGDLQGFGDLGMQFMLGFNHNPRKGWGLNSAEDTAATLEGTGTTYFAAIAGMSFPTGKWKEKLGGEIDPGMQSGFGSPAFNLGFAAARQVWGPLSMVADTGLDLYSPREGFRFGTEWRVNVAGVYEIWGRPEAFVNKIDGILEFNYLNLSRDKENGDGLQATGGNILYLTPGLRFSFPALQNASLGVGLKIPIVKWLNERSDQQGGEGLEKFRVITTLSFFF